MEKKNNGRPAFPKSIGSYRDYNGITQYNNSQSGMSLRDYFAAKAMSAILSRSALIPIDKLAEDCYDVADEMIKARGIDND